MSVLRPLAAPALLLILAIPAALLLGRYNLSPSLLFSGDPTATALFFDIRLPRVMAAVLVGGALACAGAAYQALFVNPLVSSDMLGVGAGASFGAALAMAAGFAGAVEAGAFAMALAAVALAVGIGRSFPGPNLLLLVLGGLISGALFNALLSLATWMADPSRQLPAIVYWLMGSLAGVDAGAVRALALPIAGLVLLLCLLGQPLNILSLGEDDALALGMPVGLLRGVVITAATLAAALTVALVGNIGWLGLVIPHLARLWLGPNNTLVLPASAILGGLFLLAADTLARTLLSTELPVGVLCQLVGIPFFIAALTRLRFAWAS